jgi:ABC-2 type transport system ATP-binding protein
VLPEVEEVCRRVVILAGGRVVADGGLLELADGVGEALSLTVAGVATVGGEARFADELARLDGVRSVAAATHGEQGRVRFLISVAGRFDVAERVARHVHGQGVALVELRHEVATLERIFLERTRGVQSATSRAAAATVEVTQ